MYSSKLFLDFKINYKENLDDFLKTEPASESHLNKGYQLGRQSVVDKLGMLSVVAIHYDALVEYLEKLVNGEHLAVTEKASIFLEEVLAPYQMVTGGFRDAITLLNQNSVDVAVQIRSLQATLREKDVLLKEIYHRVKNNLQVVSSLINLQIETLHDSASQSILLESATRIKSMALVHEMLYRSDNLSKIEMTAYLNNLLKYLGDAYNVDAQHIKLVTDIDPISLSIDHSIPCGLIINELISNAFKHAFPSGKSGTINISLKQNDNKIELKVSDNGVGLTQAVDMENCKTLGMKLIHSLSRQLGGQVMVDVSNGVNCKVIFTC